MDSKGASNNGGQFNKTSTNLNYTMYDRSHREINRDSNNLENNNITDAFNNNSRRYGENPFLNFV